MSDERQMEKIDKNLDAGERHLLKSLTAIALTGTFSYIFLYLFYIEAYVSVVFNLLLLLLYSLSFLFIKLNINGLSRYWSIWVFQFQIFVYSFYLFDKSSGFHIYFLVIPFLCMLIHHYKIRPFKILTALISVGCFIFRLLTDLSFNELYHLTPEQANLLYNSTVISFILGMLYLLYIFTRDISHYQEMLKQLAIKDPLTGLYNRGYLSNQIQQLYVQSRRYENDLSVIMIDIDNFKKINDTYGHQAGDLVLQTFSRILVDNSRDSDIVGRFGGEEFIIALPNTSLENTENILTRLFNNIHSTSFAVASNTTIPVTASMGVAGYESSMENSDKMVLNADEALYEAKRTGKDKWVYYG